MLHDLNMYLTSNLIYFHELCKLDGSQSVELKSHLRFKTSRGRTNFCFAVTKLTGGGSLGESSSVLISSLETSLNDFLNFSGFLLAPYGLLGLLRLRLYGLILSSGSGEDDRSVSLISVVSRRYGPAVGKVAAV